jgi:hypothetical protein
MNNILTKYGSRVSVAQLGALLGIVAAVMVGLLLSSPTIQAQNAQHGNPFTLAGTWEEQIGVAPGPTFSAIETFTESGGSIEINTGPGGPTTGIGTWVRTGPRTFLTKHTKHQFDANGLLELTIVVRRLITVGETGDEFSGRDNVELFDPAGNKLPIEIPSAPFVGKRMKTEALAW